MSPAIRYGDVRKAFVPGLTIECCRCMKQHPVVGADNNSVSIVRRFKDLKVELRTHWSEDSILNFSCDIYLLIEQCPVPFEGKRYLNWRNSSSHWRNVLPSPKRSFRSDAG